MPSAWLGIWRQEEISWSRSILPESERAMRPTTATPCRRKWSPTSFPPPSRPSMPISSRGVEEGGERGRAVVRAKIGLGHSAGALLVACQQARHRSYDALALLGFSAAGLPEVLSEEELRFVNRPEELAGVIVDLSRERFGDPLPQWSTRRTGEVEPSSAAPEVDEALAAASSRLLALVGMTAIVPGSVQPELDELRLPILVALGEHDLAGRLDVLPGQLPACPDLTLFLLEEAGHNHNVAPNRQILWKRVMRWANSVAPD